MPSCVRGRDIGHIRVHAVVAFQCPSRCGTISMTSKAGIASSRVGIYLGTLTFTAGPHGGIAWPIEMFIANDGTAGGDAIDDNGNGVAFRGTANFTSGALQLTVIAGAQDLDGVTGSLTGTFVSPTKVNATFTLSNGDMGTVSLPKAVYILLPALSPRERPSALAGMPFLRPE